MCFSSLSSALALPTLNSGSCLRFLYRRLPNQRVLWSCSQKTSTLWGVSKFKGRSRLVMGGKVRGSFHTLISECQSAKDKVAARL